MKSDGCGCWQNINVDQSVSCLACLVSYVNENRHHHISSGKGWACDIEWVPVLICSDVRAHIYKGVASCHLLHPSSFSTLFLPCGYLIPLLTFRTPQCLLPLSSRNRLSDLFQSYSQHTPNSLPIVCKVQRNLWPPPPTVSHDSFISQASFTLSHS